MSGDIRTSSRVREAFARAAEGQKSQVALDAWPVLGGGAALGKLDRSLSPDGDMNPPWPLLEAIGTSNPEVLLTALSDALGYEPPRRKPADPAIVMDEVVREMSSMNERMNELGRLVEKIAELLPKPPIRVIHQSERGRAHG